MGKIKLISSLLSVLGMVIFVLPSASKPSCGEKPNGKNTLTFRKKLPGYVGD
jgi:hypothetical protein